MSDAAQRFFKPELNVLRFVAFLMVFTFHVKGILPNRIALIGRVGDAGVSVFFVLSSYLIGELLLREKQKRGKVDLRRFYLRRALRIWPLYFTLIFGAFALAHLGRFGTFPVPGLIAFCFLAGNFYLAAVGWTISGPVTILWTISIEEQFYLLAPLVWARATRQAIMGFAVGCLCVAYLTLRLFFWHGGDDQHVWYSSLVQFQYFGVGMLLAVLLHGRRITLSSSQRSGLLIFAGLCYLASEGVFRMRSYPVGWHTCGGYFILALGGASLLIGFLDWRYLRDCPKLIYLGRISYGLYAYHLIMQAGVNFVLQPFAHRMAALPHGFWLYGYPRFILTLAATVAAAALSYRYLETPFLNLKQRFEVIESQPVLKAS